MLFRIVAFAALTVVAVSLAAIPAAAADVAVPYGDWLTASAGAATEIMKPVALGAFAWLLSRVSTPVAAMLKMTLSEQLINRSIDFAFNAVAGAEKGKVLTIHLANPVIATAAAAAVKNGPSWLVDWLGGDAGIRAKVFARLQIDPAASTSTVAAVPASAAAVTASAT